MSNYKFYVGNDEIPVEHGEITMTSSTPALGDLEWKPLRESSATFELRDVNEDWVRALQVGEHRDVRLTTHEPFHWSRWQRWLNGVLRLAWWPLGPPRLPESYEITLMVNDMHIDRVEADGNGPLKISMSNR